MMTPDLLFWPRALAELPRRFSVVSFDAGRVVDVGEPGRALTLCTDRGEVVVFAWRLQRIASAHPTPRRAARALARQARQVQRGVPVAGVVKAGALDPERTFEAFVFGVGVAVTRQPPAGPL